MTTPRDWESGQSGSPTTPEHESSPIGDELFGSTDNDTTSPGSTATFDTGFDPAPGSTSDSGDSGAKEKAAETADTAKQNAGEVAGTAKDEAAQVAGEAKDAATDLLAEARGHVDEQSRNQLQGLATRLGELGDELDQMVQGSDAQGTVTDLARQLSDRTHALSSRLADRDPQDLVADVRSFASRKPGTFIVGALAAGLVAGRVTRSVKASQSDSSSASTSGTGSATGSSSPASASSSAYGSDLPSTPPVSNGPVSGGTL